MCSRYRFYKMRLFLSKFHFLYRMQGKYLRLFPLTSFSNFHKRYLEMASKNKVCNNKVQALALGSAKINWMEGGWIIIDKYFRG